MTNRIDRVIITGAGSGIGLDMARAFLARGARLVINGRNRRSSSARGGASTRSGSSRCRARSAIPPPGARWPPRRTSSSGASTCW